MAHVGWHASHVCLDRIDGSDPLQRLLCDRRRPALRQLDELPAGVRPTERKRDAAIRRSQCLVGTVAVALQDAAVTSQQRLAMFCAAARRVVEHDRRRIGTTPGPVVTRDCPGVALLGLATTGIQHWHHGLISEQPR